MRDVKDRIKEWEGRGAEMKGEGEGMGIGREENRIGRRVLRPMTRDRAVEAFRSSLRNFS